MSLIFKGVVDIHSFKDRIIEVLWWTSVLTQKSKLPKGVSKKSKYHKNTSEINELERDLIPVKMLSKILKNNKVRGFFQSDVFFVQKKTSLRE